MDHLRSSAWCVAAWAARLRASPHIGDRESGGGDSEHGQGLAEYALILGLVAVIAIVSLTLLGTNIQTLVFDTIAGTIQGVINKI
jgi:Flp pilus assembly pilin Flp